MSRTAKPFEHICAVVAVQGPMLILTNRVTMEDSTQLRRQLIFERAEVGRYFKRYDQACKSGAKKVGDSEPKARRAPGRRGAGYREFACNAEHLMCAQNVQHGTRKTTVESPLDDLVIVPSASFPVHSAGRRPVATDGPNGARRTIQRQHRRPDV